MTQTTRWESDYIPSLFFFETEIHDISYGAHLHDTLEIGWSLSDNLGLSYRGRSYDMRYGDAVIISAGEPHGSNLNGSGPVKFASLHISSAMIRDMFVGNLLDPEKIIDMPIVKLIDSSSALSLYHEVRNTLPYTMSSSEQFQFISDLLSRFSKVRDMRNNISIEPHIHPAIKYIKSIIDDAYTRQINFSRLATEVDLHERYLIALFKSATGLPPHQYQIALRVERGRQLLERDLSLSEVAAETGFSDQSHFNRHFKRCYGVPPGTFRNSIHAF